MAGRPRKAVAAETKSNALLDALKFVSVVTKDVGPVNETHVLLHDHWAIAFNGVLAAGHIIVEDILAGPHCKTLIDALTKCGQNINITQLDNNRLSVKSNKFKVIVPCLDPTLLSISIPDQPITTIDDRFKDALESVSGIPALDDDRVVTNSILMNGKSVISTTGNIIFEYWHGIDLPPNLALPKSIIKPMLQINKKLTKFGFSSSSVTFYYDDNSWLRSQLYAEPWPDVIGRIFNRPCNPTAIPTDFFNGLATLQPFTESLIYFETDLLRTHPNDYQGGSYEVPGLPKGPIYPAKQLALIKPYAETIDFMCQFDTGYCLYFYGKQIRGIICGVKA